MKTGLKLRAESEDGLMVISAALQDAILRVEDIRVDAKAQVFGLSVSRFTREDGKGGRVKSTLQFNNILSVQAKGIERADPKAFMVLLSVAFDKDKNPPGGVISLIFAGGGELRLRAEYIEARLMDYEQKRGTDKLPLHPTN